MESTKTFAVTYDYLCPFARNVSESIVEALEAGMPYDVTFRPFSLAQNHLDEDEVAVWDRSLGHEQGRGVLALLWSIAVRDNHPDLFPRFHKAVFNARHDDGADIGDASVLGEIAADSGLDATEVAALVDFGVPAKTLAAEHTNLVETHSVFGVPTFIAGDEAVFVRLMERHAIEDIDRVIDMLSWTSLNEFKRTTIPR